MGAGVSAGVGAGVGAEASPGVGAEAGADSCNRDCIDGLSTFCADTGATKYRVVIFLSQYQLLDSKINNAFCWKCCDLRSKRKNVNVFISVKDNINVPLLAYHFVKL